MRVGKVVLMLRQLKVVPSHLSSRRRMEEGNFREETEALPHVLAREQDVVSKARGISSLLQCDRTEQENSLRFSDTVFKKTLSFQPLRECAPVHAHAGRERRYVSVPSARAWPRLCPLRFGGRRGVLSVAVAAASGGTVRAAGFSG